MFKLLAQHGHEQIVFACEPEAGLRAIVAIHNTKRGPALGGCRMHPYGSEQAALQDVLQLSKAMTYKAAVNHLPLGGGKAVVIGDPNCDKSANLWHAFGRMVERLAGRYITAADSGTTPHDLAMVAQTTRFVVGQAQTTTDVSGDPSLPTATGVWAGLMAAAPTVFAQKPLQQLRVAVQGCGAVGYHLIRLLREHRIRVVACDTATERLEQVVRAFGVESVDCAAIYQSDCDVFAPCALGGVLDEAHSARLRCKLIAGCANNPLTGQHIDRQLQQLGIVYLPDFVINAGGLIAADYQRRQAHHALEHVLTMVSNQVSRNVHYLLSQQASFPQRTLLELAYDLAEANLK